MSRAIRIDDLADLATPWGAVVSPDGSRVAYVLQTVDTPGDRNVKRLWWVAADEPPRPLTRGTADVAPAWSPDGETLAFLRADGNAPQVWLLPVGGGEAQALTTLPLGAGAPVWSPDGRSIAFTAAVDLEAGPDGQSPAGADAKPIVTDRLAYQADGVGLLGTKRQHVHVVDVESRVHRQVTAGDWYVGAIAWSPDSSRIALAANTSDDQDLQAAAPVHVVDAHAERAAPTPVALHEGFAQAIVWADTETLVVVGTTGPPAGHAHLLRVPLDGSEPTDLAAGLDRNVMAGGPAYPGATPQLVDEGTTVLFCARERGCTHVYAVALAGGEPRVVLGGAGNVVSGLSVAGGTAVTSLTTPESFGEIISIDLATGATSPLTEHGAASSDLTLFPRESREFTISDGTVVEAWLVSDPEQTGSRPLLLDVHGGPHNAWNGAADPVHLYHHELVARGWAVLLVNPRGSDGYGEDFYTAVTGAWGEIDAKDFLEPLDELVSDGLADPARLAVAGYSYGGFMTCYLTSRDDRFAAAVTGGVVSNLVSLPGPADMGPFFTDIELGAQPWDDPDLYARLSPITEVGAVSTPTLVIQGGDDVRCPIGQAQEWHYALRSRGVPTRLALYPGGSHLFILDGPPSQRIDFNRRVRDWVEQYAADASGPRYPRVDSIGWERRLAEACERHGIVGAQLGILRTSAAAADGAPADGAPGAGRRDDEVVIAAHGLLNTNTGASVESDSLFQIGSITKVWTATLAMQLVDEGLIALDTPLIEVLPQLRLADPDTTKKITLQHLLTHTSGIDGDLFTDTGRGDECLERFVGLLGDAAQNHPLGATWSYCNAGYSLLGRVIEVLTGTSWDVAIRQRLLLPLGLGHTTTLPEEALLFTAAVGHVSEGDGPLGPVKVWGLPRSTGPAGLISARAQDVLGFARLHLHDGLAPDGERVLSRSAVAAMAAEQAQLPDKHTLGDSWGLGWIRYDWDGHRLIGHDGSTLGQGAVLRMLPEHGLAVTLLTNGGDVRALYEDLFAQVFTELAGVRPPPTLGPPVGASGDARADVRPHLGTYERASVRMEVLEGPAAAAGPDGNSVGGPVLRTTVTGPLAELLTDVQQDYQMVALDHDLYVVRAMDAKPSESSEPLESPESPESWTPLTFYALPSGERYLHFGGRATRLVQPQVSPR